MNMTAEKAAYRILVASASDKMASVLREVLTGPQYRDISCVFTMGDAKRMLVSQTYDILIINTPLKDDFGIQAAIDIAEQHETGILLLVKAEMYEQVSSQVEDYGIVTLARPTTRQDLYTSVKMLSAVQMNPRARGFRERGAYCVRAHRYIEKSAMDRCVRKIRIAEEILRDS